MVQGTFDESMLSGMQGEASAGNWEEQLKQMNAKPEDFIRMMRDPILATVGNSASALQPRKPIKGLHQIPARIQSHMFCVELQAFAKQEVMAAITDCLENPMNIIKYQNDPEIMLVSPPLNLNATQSTSVGNKRLFPFLYMFKKCLNDWCQH